jgi:hypothetical protein
MLLGLDIRKRRPPKLRSDTLPKVRIDRAEHPVATITKAESNFIFCIESKYWSKYWSNVDSSKSKKQAYIECQRSIFVSKEKNRIFEIHYFVIKGNLTFSRSIS